jgi:hypothetical protein
LLEEKGIKISTPLANEDDVIFSAGNPEENKSATYISSLILYKISKGPDLLSWVRIT